MMDDKLFVSDGDTRWKCLELREDSARLHYGRFVLAPLLEGQADLIGIATRKALLEELEGTCITCAKFLDVPHQYLTIDGVEESVYDIVMNLKKVVFRSNQLSGNVPRFLTGNFRARGPGPATARSIVVNPAHVEVINKNEHIATLKQPMQLSIDLEIERNRAYGRKTTYTFREGCYPIDASFSPVLNVNHSIHTYYSHMNERKEMLLLEIWTNGSFTPVEALGIASQKLVKLFGFPLRIDEDEHKEKESGQTVPTKDFTFEDRWETLRQRQKKTKLAVESIYIDQIQLSSKVHNCLKRAEIYKLSQLLNKSYNDLMHMKMEFFGIEDAKEMILAVEKYFKVFGRNSDFF
uniref:DNA-directed RNA polymerase n=1 Tax=Anemopaegma oligoneuron TaxID=353931 RepID=A0A2L1ZSS0_9LAMI|nr:RNA polymerase alpha subunit [Anemopaegma oligoneuron]YP_009471320.1 RNA polymerase alpha subunit [Anemopaegma oligoneuron]AVF97999.1 RNA polymerase alpha subunit [Anemopaegma oligoneuron]AVF98042.1 RNA polymerase alpha subunit [Anemopaegma oligoneuron]